MQTCSLKTSQTVRQIDARTGRRNLEDTRRSIRAEENKTLEWFLKELTNETQLAMTAVNKIHDNANYVLSYKAVGPLAFICRNPTLYVHLRLRVDRSPKINWKNKTSLP